MGEFDNVINLQRSQNYDVRLPALDVVPGGYYPLTAKDMQIVRHEILARLAKSLPDNGIFRRKEKLYHIETGRDLSEIPENLFARAFESIECQIEITETVEVERKGFKNYKKIKHFQTMTDNLHSLRPYIDNVSVTNQVISAKIVPELVFENERPPQWESWVFPKFPPAPVEAEQMADYEFDFWFRWMQQNAPEQLQFFIGIGLEYVFSAEMAALGENQARRIHVGVGANAGGKGTMIRFLNAMATMRPEHSFVFDDLCEWRSGQVFVEGSPMAVCHEFHLDKPLSPGFVGMFKSATRNEVLSVRLVGSAAQSIRYEGAIVLFCNSNFERQTALHEAMDYFANWVAYDRFNIVYIDWFLKYPRQEQLKKILHLSPAITRAFGERIKKMILEHKGKEIQYNPIPAEYRTERGSGSVKKWENKLVDLWEGWQEWQEKIDQSLAAGMTPDFETQRKIAMGIFAGIFATQKDVLAHEFFEFDPKTGLLFTVLSARASLAILEKYGANRKWNVPPGLIGRVEKNVCLGKSNQSKAKYILFTNLGEHFDG
jgi:hypothetical protein